MFSARLMLDVPAWFILIEGHPMDQVSRLQFTQQEPHLPSSKANLIRGLLVNPTQGRDHRCAEDSPLLCGLRSFRGI